jgi:hypothetical protein
MLPVVIILLILFIDFNSLSSFNKVLFIFSLIYTLFNEVKNIEIRMENIKEKTNFYKIKNELIYFNLIKMEEDVINGDNEENNNLKNDIEINK